MEYESNQQGMTWAAVLTYIIKAVGVIISLSVITVAFVGIDTDSTLSLETAWTIISETFVLIDTFWCPWNITVVVSTVEGLAIMGSGCTLVDVSTSSATIIAV